MKKHLQVFVSIISFLASGSGVAQDMGALMGVASMPSSVMTQSCDQFTDPETFCSQRISNGSTLPQRCVAISKHCDEIQHRVDLRAQGQAAIDAEMSRCKAEEARQINQCKREEKSQCITELTNQFGAVKAQCLAQQGLQQVNQNAQKMAMTFLQMAMACKKKMNMQCAQAMMQMFKQEQDQAASAVNSQISNLLRQQVQDILRQQTSDDTEVPTDDDNSSSSGAQSSANTPSPTEPNNSTDQTIPSGFDVNQEAARMTSGTNPASAGGASGANTNGASSVTVGSGTGASDGSAGTSAGAGGSQSQKDSFVPSRDVIEKLSAASPELLQKGVEDGSLYEVAKQAMANKDLVAGSAPASGDPTTSVSDKASLSALISKSLLSSGSESSTISRSDSAGALSGFFSERRGSSSKSSSFRGSTAEKLATLVGLNEKNSTPSGKIMRDNGSGSDQLFRMVRRSPQWWESHLLLGSSQK